LGGAEARALVATTRLAQQWLDPALAQASESALSRVMSVLSAAQRQHAQGLAVYGAPLGCRKPFACACSCFERLFNNDAKRYSNMGMLGIYSVNDAFHPWAASSGVMDGPWWLGAIHVKTSAPSDSIASWTRN